MKYIFEVNHLGDNSLSISVNIQDTSGQTSTKRIMTSNNLSTMENIENDDNVNIVLKEVLDDMRFTVKEREDAELNLSQFIEYIQKSKK